MSIAIAVWQAVIVVSLIASGRARAWVALFWIAWTVVQVVTFPLSLLQFFTIVIGYKLSSALGTRQIHAKSQQVARPAADSGTIGGIVALVLLAVYLLLPRESHVTRAGVNPTVQPTANALPTSLAMAPSPRQQTPSNNQIEPASAEVEIVRRNADGTCLLRPAPRTIVQGKCPELR